MGRPGGGEGVHFGTNIIPLVLGKKRIWSMEIRMGISL